MVRSEQWWCSLLADQQQSGHAVKVHGTVWPWHRMALPVAATKMRE